MSYIYLLSLPKVSSIYIPSFLAIFIKFQAEKANCLYSPIFESCHRFPFEMAQWADGPFGLNPTCKTLKPSGPPKFVVGVDSMANSHNAMIRALNSIYLQAPYVKSKEDKHDLLLYTTFW